MYYCKSCGFSSQGEVCANQKCKAFCRPSETKPALKNLNSNVNATPQTHYNKDELSANFRSEPQIPGYMDTEKHQQPFEINPQPPIEIRPQTPVGMPPQPPQDMNQRPQWNLDFGESNNTYHPHIPLDENTQSRSKEYQLSNNTKCNMPIPSCNESLQISFATVPFQRFETIYPVSKGLTAGTIFPELDMPYTVRKIFGGYNG